MLDNIFKNLRGSLKDLTDSITNGTDVSAFGLSFGERTHIASLFQQRFVLYVCPDIIAAKKTLAQLKCLFKNKNIFLLPPKEDNLTYVRAGSKEISQARIEALFNMVLGRAAAVVTTPEALCSKFPAPHIFRENILYFYKNAEYDLASAAKYLISCGYKREALVGSEGQFSIRGDILDIFPIGANAPYRLDFFGNTLEKIKTFDPEKQVSFGDFEMIEICPATTLFLSARMAQDCIRTMREDYSGKLAGDFDTRIKIIMNEVEARLLSGDRDPSLSWIEAYLNDTVHLRSYLPKDALVVFDECKQICDIVSNIYTEHCARFKQLLQAGEVLPKMSFNLVDEDFALHFDCTKLGYHKLTTANNIFEPKAVFNFSGVPLPRYSKDYAALAFDVKHWTLDGYSVFFCCGSTQSAEILVQALNGMGTAAAVVSKPDQKPTAQALPLYLDYGFIHHEQKTVVLGENELKGKTRAAVSRKRNTDIFNEIKQGDFVVHFTHGVGIFEGVVRIDNTPRDYISIAYKEGDHLYVPIENMDSISKFTGSNNAPALNRLGGKDFAKIKQKARESIKKLAFDLTALYAKREQSRGEKIEIDEILLKEFGDSFEFEETPDQLRAIEEIKGDFQKGKIMDRLLCGDVGYGKTEVSLRAAFIVMMSGYQAAFLAPTTILAQQHYNTAKARLEPFGIRVECLSRFKTKAEINRILDDLSCGRVDFVCGTHRLLSKDVKFKNLGILLLDEEQRFGVGDKEKIKQIKNNINVLTLTATPIPRTLHMSLSGIRDISLLDSPPKDRIPIQTYVTEYSDALVYDAVVRELNRGGQTFIVYNRVEKIEAFRQRLSAFLPDARIIVAHGQMDEQTLERAVGDFYEGNADVLLCSTIIENGIDLPRANTMIVCDADRLGLSQLYQLRGRVGRSNRLSYVYFTFNQDKILSENAYKRLSAITEFTEFGSGFKVAMRDLEIRGAGNILGREQHGNMEKIGYELYCRLLQEEIETRQNGNAVGFDKETRIDTDLEAFIPSDYVSDEQGRMRLFRRISQIESIQEEALLQKETEDIYGALPLPVKTLFKIGLIKNLASRIGADRVRYSKSNAKIVFSKVADLSEGLMKSISEFGNGCILRISQNPSIVFEDEGADQRLLDFLLVQ